MVYCYLFNPTIRFMVHFFMKKKLTVLSILIAAVLVVSACTGMVSTTLTANWHTRDIEYDPAFTRNSPMTLPITATRRPRPCTI